MFTEYTHALSLFDQMYFLKKALSNWLLNQFVQQNKEKGEEKQSTYFQW